MVTNFSYLPRLNGKLYYQPLEHQNDQGTLVTYFPSMSCAHCTSRQWNKLQFLNEIKCRLFKFHAVIFTNICGDNLNYSLLICGTKLALEDKIYYNNTMFWINCRIFYKHVVGRLHYRLLSADWPRYQEPDISRSYSTRRHRPRLRYSWPVQRYRTGRVPLMDILHSSNDLRTGRDIPLEPFRRYEGNSYLNMWKMCFAV